MYLPKHFQEHDQAEILRFMETHAFATLVTVVDGLPFASHIPLLVQAGEPLTLLGHLARPNPQWKHLQENKPVLAMFQGPHTYISPTWYENTGVPTWNYTAVHAYGTVRVMDDVAELRAVVERLSAYYEGNGSTAWKPEFPEKMLEGIVGFEITVTDLQAKYKLNQNRSAADQRKVVEALRERGRGDGVQVAELMARNLEK